MPLLHFLKFSLKFIFVRDAKDAYAPGAYASFIINECKLKMINKKDGRLDKIGEYWYIDNFLFIVH